MILELTKPLAFIDLETTGLKIGYDRIIEFSVLKFMPDGSRKTYTQRVNPEMEIHEEALKVHKISLEELQHEPTFAEVARQLVNFIDNSDLCGFNIMKFDLPMLIEEFMRVNVDFKLEGRKVIDAQHIFHKMEKRDLAAAYRFYCNKQIENQHSAEADIQATYEVLMAQVQKYKALKNNVDAIYEFLGKPLENMVDLANRLIKNSKGEVVFNFGKYKGQKVEDIFEKDPSYYSWMMNGDFPAYTKKKLTELYIQWKKK